MEVYIFCHGDISHHSKVYLTGRIDIPLDEDAKSEIEGFRKGGYYPAAEGVFTSPLTRCVESAVFAYPEIVPFIVEEFNEFNYGEFEGMEHQLLANNEGYKKFCETKMEQGAKQGETNSKFIDRLRRGFINTASKSKELGFEKIAIFTHPDCIMKLMATFLAREDEGCDIYEYQTAYGKGYRVILGENLESFEKIDKL